MTLVDLAQLIVGGLTMGGIYALTALSFHIVFHATDCINFAQGEQVILGGVLFVSLALSLNNVPWPLAFVIAVFIATVVGFLYERVAIRPLIRVSETAVIVASIGVAVIMRNVIVLAWGKDQIRSPAFSGETPVDILGAKLVPQSFWVLGLTIAAVIAVTLFFDRTLTGKAIRATADNHVGAQLVGIRPTRIVAYCFGISAGLAAMAGIVISPITFAGGYLGMPIALKGIAGAIIGGISRPMASILGGFLLGVVESLVSGLITSGYRDVFTFGLLLLALLFRPSGLFVKGEVRGE